MQKYMNQTIYNDDQRKAAAHPKKKRDAEEANRLGWAMATGCVGWFCKATTEISVLHTSILISKTICSGLR